MVGGSAGFALAAALFLLGGRPPRTARFVHGGLAAATGLACALSGAAPTGLPPLDVVLLAGLGATAVLGAAVAPPVLLVVLAAALTGFHTADQPDTLAAAGAAAALGVGPLAVVARRRTSLPAAAAGGFLVLSSLGLAWPDFIGGPTLVGIVVVAPLVVLALTRGVPPARRRAVGLAVTGLVVVATFGASAALVAAGLSYRDLDDAMRASRAGLAAARDAQRERAADRFDAAAAAFGRADQRLGAWWARPGLAVPVAGHHLRAVRAVTESGHELAAAAAAEARDVDPDTVRVVDGQVNLAAVARLEPALARTAVALTDAERRVAEVRSPWLVGLVSERLDEFEDEVTRAAADARRAHDAVVHVPALLGAEGPRRYFLAVVTPAQSRAGGGFLGNWGEITAVDGKLTMERFGRISELDTAGAGSARTLEGAPPEYVSRYRRFAPATFMGNVPFSPDFPSIAQVLAVLYPQAGGAPIDGVLSVDPIGLAAVLALTGPVEVPDWPEPLAADNAERILLHEQYVAFDLPPDREDFLGDVTELVWDALTSGTVPGPDTLGRVLGPVAAGRHLQLVTFDDTEQAFLERLGTTGAVPPVDGDSIGVFTQNAAGNKMDWFLHRRIDYAVVYDPDTGAARGELTVELRNEAPDSGLPRSVIGGLDDVTAPGENRLYTSVYSPLEVVGADLDGEPVQLGVETELGRNVYSAFIRVPSRSTVVLRLHLEGTLDVGGGYRLDLLRQPLVRADDVRVHVIPRRGWPRDDATARRAWRPALTLEGQLDRTQSVRVAFD